VVQQGAAPSVQLFTREGGDRHEREARSAAAAVVARRPFAVMQRTTPRVQRLGISDALDYFAPRANAIPGFRMFTIVLGVNPINMSRVDRSPANIMRAVVEFMPGGFLITQALDSYGVIDRAGAWVDEQIRTLGTTGAVIRQALDDFLHSLSFSDIFNLGGVWERAKEIFGRPIRRITDFLAGLVAGVLRFIKDAILRPLAGLASQTRGWDLLKAVLGRDPISGDPVPRNAETLIGGFMKLIGQDEVWENIKRANAIPRAWAWFQGALEGLMGFVRQIPGMFISALRELEIADLILVPRAFARIARVFGDFALRFFTWAGQQVLTLLQLIFEVVAPNVMPYLRKAAGAFRTIIADPIRFIGYLVRAGIQGFRQFGANFLSHLRASLIQWLTGTLAGANIYIPQAFEIREIIKFVLSVLGLTWQNIRAKLVRLIPEPVVTALETTFDIVVTLVREGPAAAWEKIKEQLSNLKDMVMEQVMTFVRDRIVQAAITRLVTSLNPAGAFIQAVIAIYNTIMFFVERLRTIAQVVASYIDAIAEIASGAIGAAANKVEQTMAGLLTLVISFLARLVGLGNVSQAVVNIVNRIRAPIDRALDRVVEWIVNTARRIGRVVASGAQRAVAAVVGWWRTRKAFRTPAGEPHTLFFRGEGATATLILSSSEQPYRTYLANLRIPPTDAAKGPALATANAKLNEIEALKERNLTDGEKTQEFTRLLNELASATTVLLAGSPLPDSTPPIYGGRSAGGFATSMTINVLTKNGPSGSTPDDGLSGAVWDILKKRYERASSSRRFYKLGHLLSWKLHGPGDTWSNLSPQSESGNQTFERRVEKPIKRMVDDGKGFRYSVTASYGRSANKSAIIATWVAANDPRLAEKQAILDAEDKVPTGFRYEFVVVFEGGSLVQGRTVEADSTPNDIRQEADKYHLK
jgi:hypothetical protein